jgi:hypothetical protein
LGLRCTLRRIYGAGASPAVCEETVTRCLRSV